jgi:hypothetical protein
MHHATPPFLLNFPIEALTARITIPVPDCHGRSDGWYDDAMRPEKILII